MGWVVTIRVLKLAAKPAAVLACFASIVGGAAHLSRANADTLAHSPAQREALVASFCNEAPQLCLPSAQLEIFWRQFCETSPAICANVEPESASLDERHTIMSINRLVNGSIRPVNNQPLGFGIPGYAGDCKTYAMTKYFLLAWNGIPPGAMRFAAVHRTGDEDDHFVLLIRIGAALFVLDNLTDVVWPTDSVRYEWLAIQREDDRMAWQEIENAPL